MVKEEIILSTAKEMFKFQEAIYTHSEYKTDFEDFCIRVCESFARPYIYHGDERPAIIYDFLEGGKVKVNLCYYLYYSVIEDEVEELVKEDLKAILKKVLEYINNKMSVEEEY